jgi:hypothetical protein
MKLVSIAAILATFLSCAFASAGRVSHRSYTSLHFDLASGTQVPWYECKAQGNYPDPTTCDHYIACTAANIAYQMPCADMDEHGNRLHYVPDSGPNEQQSYCDYPEFAGCPIGGNPSTTTNAPPHNGPCPEGVVEGGPCNTNVDCHQCGECDWFMRCEDNKWVKGTCDFRAEADGTIHVSKKLFWNQGGNIHGGTCVPWNNLKDNLKEDYLADPTCKPICDYWGDKSDPKCLRKYFYVDPVFAKDIWYMPATELMCASNTKWEQSTRSCVFCTTADNCEANC